MDSNELLRQLKPEIGYYYTFDDVVDIIHKGIQKYINNQKEPEKLKVRWKKLNNMYKDAFISEHKTHLFKTYTGSGKTVTGTLWLKSFSKFKLITDGFVILSAEYEHGTDEIERILVKHGDSIDYIRFEGKNRLCPILDIQIGDTTTTLRELMNNNISITPYCSEECAEFCKYRENCSVLLSKDKTKNWIGVSHQLNKFFPIYLKKVGKVSLMLDEDFSDAIKEHHRFDVEKIRNNLKFLELIITERKIHNKNKFKIDILLELAHSFKEFFDLLLKSLYNFNEDKLDYEKILGILDDIDITKGDNNEYVFLLNKYAYKYIVEGKIRNFCFILGDIANFVDNLELEFEDLDRVFEFIDSVFFKNKKNVEITMLYYNKFIVDRLFGDRRINKIIINDATANQKMLSYISNDPYIIEHNEDWYYSNCEVYQIKKKLKDNNTSMFKYAQYPKSSMCHEATFFYLIDDLKTICERHKDEPILVISREIESDKIPFAGGLDLSEYLQSLGHSKLHFEDYPLSGTNVYSGVNVVVAFGKPELPNSVVRRQSVLIGMEKNEYRIEYSKNLLKQGIGRIFRGNERKFIYLLTGFDIGIKAGKYYTFNGHKSFREKLISKMKREQENEKQNKLMAILYDYFNINDYITITTFSELFDISKYKSKNELEILTYKGYLYKKVGNRGLFMYYKINT